MKKVILALGILLLSSNSAFAVDLTNKDNQAYKIKVTEGSVIKEISIDPGTTQKVCNTACQIDVDAIGSINATGTETVEIENGAIVIPQISIL